MRLLARDIGSHTHHIEVLLNRPAFGRPHQRTPDTRPSDARVDNQANKLDTLTGLQEHASLSGNPTSEAASRFGDRDEVVRGVKEYGQPPGDLLG